MAIRCLRLLAERHAAVRSAADLDAYLKAGPPPIYIGFGSTVIENPETLDETLLDAVKKCGVRAIIPKDGAISKAWNLTKTSFGLATVHMVSHTTLWRIGIITHCFGRVAVPASLRGGASWQGWNDSLRSPPCSTYHHHPVLRRVGPLTLLLARLLNSHSQPLWGNMVAHRGAGPRPIPYRQLTSLKLAAAIKFSLGTGAKQAAEFVATQVQAESGAKAAGQSFHRDLPVDVMRCTLIPNLPATWLYTKPRQHIQIVRRCG